MINKRVGVLLICIKLSQMLQAQNMPAWSGAFYSTPDLQTANPAMISSTPYRRHLQVFSLSAFAGGNHATLGFSHPISNGATWVKSRLLSTEQGSSAMASLQLQGPSGYQEIPKLGTIGFSIGSRMFANANNIDGRLLSELDDHGVPAMAHPYTLPLSDRMTVSATAFSQLRLFWAKTVHMDERHVLRLGLAANLLIGAAHTDLQFENLQGTVKYNTYIHDGYLTAASGNIAVRTSGSFFDSQSFGTLMKGKASLGIGFGIAYEWKDKATVSQQRSDGEIPYRFRVGIGIKDIGTLRYAPDTAYSKAHTMLVPSDKALYLHSSFNLAHFYDVAKTLDAYPSLFKKGKTTTGDYVVSLPSSLDVSFEYRFRKGYYMVGYSSLGLATQSQNSSINTWSIAALSIGYEKKAFGFSIPVSYHPFTKLSAGAGFRYKWITASSSSLFTSLSGKGKQLDGCIGFSLSKF